ncbi:hypothetical protein BsWGS_04653 [Bradybaena similaris]
MSNISAYVTFLLAVVAINFCFCQIHFTPDWGQGKRSQNSHIDEQDTSYCQEQLELNLLFEVTNMLTRQAKRLSSCMKGCPNLR